MGQQVFAQHQGCAQGVDAALRRALEGAELGIEMDTGIRAARDTRREVALGAAAERLDQFILGRFGDEVRDQLLRGFEQQTGRVATLVVDDPAALGRGGVGGDAGQAEGARIDDAEVAGGVRDDDRMVGRDGVKVVPGWVAALGERLVVVAAPDHPSSSRRLRRPLRDAPLEFRDRPAARRAAIYLTERAAEHQHVIVRLIETRQQRLPTQINDPRARRGQRAHIGGQPDGDDPVAAHEHRFRLRMDGVHRHDRPVHKERVMQRHRRAPSVVISWW
jgi:hypothetical protein